MVIMGPKPIPDEEPEPSKSHGKSQNFTTRWVKSFTQNFSTSTSTLVGEGDSGPSDPKKKGKMKGRLGQVFKNMVRVGDKRLPNEEQRRFKCKYFNLKQIKAATQNFSHANKIGEGGFGPVYKGVLPDKTAIAVKKLSETSNQGSSEFRNEVNTISTLTHPNVVKLLGCCADKNQLLLVYEFMENGSLQSALFGGHDGNLKGRLNWPARVQICLGIAKGLAFLHDDKSKPKIVHRDIKPSNVLLDEYLNPKISDFGLARQYEEDQTQINTQVAGTCGYLSPELLTQGALTEKADVYSFGLLTLELMSGKRRFHINDKWVYVQDLAAQLQEKGDLLALIHEDLKTSIAVKEATIVLELALLCTNMSPILRPTMSAVVSILEGRSVMKSAPPQPEPPSSTRGDSETATNNISVHYIAISEPPIQNASSWTPTTEDVTKVEDKGELEYVEPSFEKGKLHIKCSDGELEVGCNKWKDSLVGYFVGEKEPFNIDKEMVKTLWEPKGNVFVFSIGSGYFLFQFNCVEDKIRVLESSDLWHIEQRLLVLRKWDWKLKFNKAEMKSLPIWVKIYNLPLFLWSSSFFSMVGSGLGIPLYVDKKTNKGERLDYAKLCIEVYASKPLPESLDISVKGIDYQLKLEYDWKPFRCANCCTFGHTESECRLKTMETKQN